MPPDLVGARYRLGQPLGSGGMGKVWEAEDTVLQRAVAVKAVDLPPHLDDDDRQSLRTRVLREARAAARIDHPASVRVFDVVDDGHRLHVVMELVRAPTLRAVVSRDGPLSPARAATVGLGVLDALEAAHSAGIVHRDVKPANVMMLDDGSVKLADFGIASVKDDTRITAAGLVLGTPSYMAPEQARGQPAGPPADLWGLGALLYFAVEGVAPFERGEALPTLNAVLHDEPRPMARADGLASPVHALLAKAPEDRPAIAQVRAALETVAGVSSPAAAAVTASDRSTAVMPAAGAPVRAGDDTPSPPFPPGPPRGSSPRRRRSAQPDMAPAAGRPPSAWAWLAGLAAVAVVAVVAGLALAGSDNTRSPSADPATSTTSPAPGQGAPAQGDASATTTAPEGPTTTAPSGPRPDGVPADWAQFRERSTGYSIWHPPSWNPQPQGDSRTDFVDPATGDYLRVDYVQPPGDDPVKAWKDAAKTFARAHPDYSEIRIDKASYRDFDAAIWEYTYEGRHATNLGFVSGDYGFALNFQTGAQRWDERQYIRQAFEAGFTPPR
ncbi:MAG: protein kinase domain-containing protein [Acidimicrobiales bacterium]